MPGTVRITASRLAEIPGAFGSNGCRTRHPLFPHDNMKNALSMKDETTYDRYPVYRGDDLELTYSPEGSSFRLWAPSAERVRLRLYGAGEGGGPLLTQSMDASSDGTWTAELPGDRKGLFYTFGIFYDGRWLSETPGVRAKAVGVNGDRAAIVDLRETDPEGWEKDLRPPMSSPTDIVIYEMHHRDLSIAPDSGVKHKGKYLALTEEGTRSAEGLATGLDHLKELGVTHVHLLPSFDFGSIDESRLQDGVYDWGYDPKNYFVPEGSYATDPYDPAVRIREFKQMVRSLHRNGIRVVMDAVYNHTHRTEESNFSLTVPGYYYRHEADGSFPDATGCGNETASERAMMRRLIVDAVCYWAEEYHVDGFRFDLMGVHDIGTMNEVRRALDRIDPSILLYGEGWTAARSPLDESLRAVKRAGPRLPRIAVFDDDLRDALRGGWGDSTEPGFVSGKSGLDRNVRFGVVGATAHFQVGFDSSGDSPVAYGGHSAETINYVSCHDDLSLVDKLRASAPEGMTEEELVRFDKLAQTVVLTAQGIPSLFAGEEMLRTKGGVSNSHDSPDRVNRIDWSFKADHKDVFDYYRGLIALRRTHPAFRLATAAEIERHLRFLDTGDTHVVAYMLVDHAGDDPWREILVVYNGARAEKRVRIPPGDWHAVCLDGRIASEALAVFSGDSVPVPAFSALIAYLP